MLRSNERGIALVTVLLVMMLMSALLVGFTAVVVSDQRYRFIDQDRTQAFYAATGGVEKLTVDLGNLFSTTIAPTATQITALTTTASMPVIAGVSYAAQNRPDPLPSSSLSGINCLAPNARSVVGLNNGYTITFCAAASGNPAAVQPIRPIKSGFFEGLPAIQTPYQIDATARTSAGGEVHLARAMTAVAIPVFEFGMFSDPDLSFFAGPDFNFGGRVHTNGSLFLAQGDGATLTFSDRVTAFGDVVRQQMQNGVSIDTASAHRGTVNLAIGGGAVRSMLRTEGSVVNGPGSAANTAPPWITTSMSSFNTWIRNGNYGNPGGTGVKPLNLAVLSVGGSNPDLIRRPAVNENVSNAALYGERLFTKASLRILLSDTAAEITSLPGVTSSQPVLLDNDWNKASDLPNDGAGTSYGPINLSHPPIARTATGSVTATIRGGSTANRYHVDASEMVSFLPTMMLGGSQVVCARKNANSFSFCDVTVTAGNGATLAGPPGVTPVTTGGAAAGNNRTITVTAGDTSGFRPIAFWLGDKPVTCSGWDNSPSGFTGCSAPGSPVPANNDIISNQSLSASGSGLGLIGGYLKIERQNANSTWTDVTIEILNYGIGANNLDVSICQYPDPNQKDPSPTAIVRLQRLRDNGGVCDYNTVLATDSSNWWPNVLFDPREALVRDTAIAGTPNLPLGGVMHYITLDVKNLSRWFAGTLPGTGASAKTENGGFTVYFSDRRNNRDAADLETGEYGWEDFVNLGSTGVRDGALELGEDVNANGLLDTYGSLPNYTAPGASASISAPSGMVLPLGPTARPWTLLTRVQAQVNRAVLFRHALKLTNGEDIQAQGITGLTIASENPVYIQGNWNANGTFAGLHAATAVMADAVTLLSGKWNDTVSFTSPYDPMPGNGFSGRPRQDATWYRLGIIAGKGKAFPQPAGTANDFGTDGGAHNFLRYLEGGNSQNVNYRGSIATFFYNRQAVGTFKCCNTVYTAPTRLYNFDTDSLDPSLLPPNTPLFRDLSTVGFAQEMRPGK